MYTPRCNYRSRPLISLAHKTDIHNIAKIRKVLSIQDAEKLIHTFITSQIDYCNAHTITRTKKYEHISPALAYLHWLPVKNKIDFKVLFLTYKALNGLGSNDLEQQSVTDCQPRPLRYQGAGLLVIPSIKKHNKRQSLLLSEPCPVEKSSSPSEKRTPFPSSSVG